MTFRVSRIPDDFRVEDLSQAIKRWFDLESSEYIIHSLAPDACDEADPLWKTATVSFRNIPALLRRSQSMEYEYDFELPAFLAEEFGRSRIYFDTHFKGFTPLSPTHRDTEGTIDCIVIPGWGGHALGSFRSHTNTYVWIRDSLPKHCPQLRVWTYGYQSRLTDGNSSADVYEFAKRFRDRLRILAAANTTDTGAQTSDFYGT